MGNSTADWPGTPLYWLFIAAAFIFVFVVLAAVLAPNAERREAAFKVLDRILRALMGR